MNIREILRRVITPPATIPAPEPAGSSGGTDAQELCPSGGYLREDEEHVARLMVGRQQADPAVFTDAFGMKVDPSYCSWVKAGEVETKSPFPSSYFCDGIEFTALALALLKYSAGQPNFTVVELGAGWGPWITMAALCAKRLGFENISLVAFEADPHRYETLRRHLALNGITEDQYHLSLLCAAAWWRTETLYWPRGVEYDAGRMAVSGERPTHDYRGIESTFDQVPGLSISEALNDYPHIDFLHIDVQGSEWELVKNSVEFLSSRVRTMFIGTHSRKIEGDLIELLRNSGWVLLRERPCAFYSMSPSPTLTGQTFRDGGQVWGNLRSTTQNQIAATAHRPESELRGSRAREPDRVLEDGDVANVEDSDALVVCRAIKALHGGVVTPDYGCCVSAITGF